MTMIWTVPVTEPRGRVTGLTVALDVATVVDPTEVTFTERESGTVYATVPSPTQPTRTVRVTVSYLDGSWAPRYPMAPQWIIDLWMETS